MFAAHYGLDNLCVMVDANGLQIDGPVRKVMNVEPIDKKLQAFGFETICIDGHDFPSIFKAFDLARQTKDRQGQRGFLHGKRRLVARLRAQHPAV